MRLMTRRKLIAFALASLSFFAVGCGGKGTVSGKVAYKKTPLPAGLVLFKTESGDVFHGQIQDGSYTVENVPTGAVKIGIEVPVAPKGVGGKNVPPPKGKMGPPKGVTLPEGVEIKGPSSPFPPGFQFPPYYRDPDKSNLTYTVTSGPQEHNINLE
jgi:hypothetical protein